MLDGHTPNKLTNLVDGNIHLLVLVLINGDIIRYDIKLTKESMRAETYMFALDELGTQPIIISQRNWSEHGYATPISGDPYFTEPKQQGEN